MARNLVDIILRITKEGTGGKDVQKELEGVEQTTKKAEKGFGSLGETMAKGAVIIGGVTAALATLKKAYDFGKEGAAIAQTSESFNRLMVSMDAGPNVLQKLRDASLGTVDDMTLMSSTMTLLAGTSEQLGSAMVDAAPQLMEIAKAANKLNPTLGDTAFLYQSLSTGIKRSSPLILDNLGLVVKVGDANEAMAKQLGKSVEELTAEEKQMALLNATLKAGDRMIQQVGGSTEAAGDSFAQMETEVKNLTDQIKQDAYPAIRDVVKVVGELVGVLKEAYDGTSTWGRVLGDTLNPLLQLKHAVDDLKDYFGISADEQEKWSLATQKHDEIMRDYSDTLLANMKAAEDMEGATEGAATASFRMADAAEDAAFQVREQERAELAAKQAADEFKVSMQNLDLAMKGIGYEEHVQTLEDLESKLVSLEGTERALGQAPLVSTSQTDRLADLRKDIGETQEKLEAAKLAFSTMMAEGASEEDLGKAQANIDKWQDRLDELNTGVSRVWRDISNNTAEELARVRQEMGETAEAIDAEKEAWARNTREIAFNIAERQILDALEKGLIEDVNNSGTAFDEANQMLWALAEGLGLTDEATILFMQSVQNITGDMIEGEVKTQAWIDTISAYSNNVGDATTFTDGLGSAINSLPDSKRIDIKVATTYTFEGTEGEQESGMGGGEAYNFQHGGQFRVRGPAGPDRVPVRFMATRGEVVTVTPVGGVPPANPAVTNNYNLTVNSNTPSAGIIQDFGIMQDLVQ